MLWRRKQRAWYGGVLVLFFALRMLFRFARMFIKVVDRQAEKQEKRFRQEPAMRRKWKLGGD
ncbi:MAG: hypothetical protein JXA71_11580 [Chitinispirillaceae bacterium]|nr:hypothetical protein [Chitinispirillaceae bacterium]